MKKAMFYLIGMTILGILLYPRIKRSISDTKQHQEECERKLNEAMKEKKDEELRHEKVMERIKEEENEMYEKSYEDVIERIERCKKMMQYYGTDIHCMAKYRDSNGEIHEFDAADPEQVRMVMRDKRNKIIF